MKDVATVLRGYVGDRLPQLLADLEATNSGQTNIYFREFLRRIRRGAGLPVPVSEKEPKALLALMEK